MNKRELKKLKEKHFAESSRRTGIPLQFYELTPAMIDAYEAQKQKDREAKEQQKQRQLEIKKNLNPTRGEVDLRRRVRREVGM